MNKHEAKKWLKERPGNIAMWTVKPDDEDAIYWRKVFKLGCEQYWTTHVLPLKEELSLLKSREQTGAPDLKNSFGYPDVLDEESGHMELIYDQAHKMGTLDFIGWLSEYYKVDLRSPEPPKE